MSGIAALFRKKKIDPKEAVRHWKLTLRAEERKLDRQLREIEFEEKKIAFEIKKCAKRNDMESCNTLAKEIVRSRRVKNSIHTNKAQMHSVVMQMNQNLATARVCGHLSQSTDIMQMMNQLVKVPQIMETMRTMEQEMTKAGVIEEMVADTLGADEDEIEEESSEEVTKVLMELTGAALAGAAPVPAGGLPTEATPAAAEGEEGSEPKMQDMQRRLAELQSG